MGDGSLPSGRGTLCVRARAAAGSEGKGREAGGVNSKPVRRAVNNRERR
jgi:hypothetical protein